MKVRLTRKYADEIDGVDLHDRNVGDVIDMSKDEAGLLLAEKWALPERRGSTEPSPTFNRRQDDPQPNHPHDLLHRY
jgi:hypothetical protein